nr:MAG TPA: hypothetical protein [Bacteriophage sp.]
MRVGCFLYVIILKLIFTEILRKLYSILPHYSNIILCGE